MTSNEELLAKLEEMSLKMEEMKVEIDKQSTIANHLTGYFQVLDFMKSALNVRTLTDSIFGSNKNVFIMDEKPLFKD